jgi:NodT family efflux transporter outer membrane factor (OMF) lipoprotein
MMMHKYHGRRLHLIAGVILALLSSACSVAPTYEKPTLPLAAAYKEAPGQWVAVDAAQVQKIEKWWQQLGSAELNDLIERATSDNLQIQTLLARQDSANAFVKANEAAYSPQVTVAGGDQQNRQSDDRPLRGATQPPTYQNNFAYLNATYELDLFGRIKNSVTSASALSAAAQADLQAVRLVVQANIVSAYCLIQSLDTQIAVQTSVLNLLKRRENILGSRLQQGFDAPTIGYRSQTVTDAQVLRLSDLKTRRAQLEHLLATLLGVAPANFSLPAGDIQRLKLPAIPQSVPSELLVRRPDILSAEKKVEAANADIGVAKSAFFPSLVLGAMGGVQNTGNRWLFNSPDRFWTVGPTLFATVFDGGRRDALVDQAVARNKETIAAYKATVINSFKEVEDLMADLNNLNATTQNVQRSLMASAKNYKAAESQFQVGTSSFLDTIDPAIQKSQFELQLIDHQTQMLVQTSALIKALGGYWQ